MAVHSRVCSHCHQLLAQEKPEPINEKTEPMHEKTELCCLIDPQRLQLSRCVVVLNEPCCHDFEYTIDRYTGCHGFYSRHMGFDRHISAFGVCTLFFVKKHPW